MIRDAPPHTTQDKATQKRKGENMTIYEKLLEVQSKLKAPKSQRNNFGQYNYRSCEDILEAVKPILKEHKTTTYLTDDVVFIEGRFYVKATAMFVDIETGDKVTVTAFAREEESKKGADGSQVTGASSSYARKYALNGLFAIDDTKDSDATNKGEKTTTKPKEEDKAVTDARSAVRLSIAKAKKNGILREVISESLKREIGMANYNAISDVEKLKKAKTIIDGLKKENA